MNGWLSTDQACAVLGIRSSRLTRLRRAGRFALTFCDRGAWYYRKESVEQVKRELAGAPRRKEVL